MALPFGLGATTVSGTGITTNSTLDNDGVPNSCRMGIDTGEDGGDTKYIVPLFTAACMMPILGKSADYKLAETDFDRLWEWWSSHPPEGYPVNDPRAMQVRKGAGMKSSFREIWDRNGLAGSSISKIDASGQGGGLVGRDRNAIDDIADVAVGARDTLESIGDMFAWITDPFNIIRIIAIIVGIAFVSMGLKKVMNRDEEANAQGSRSLALE